MAVADGDKLFPAFAGHCRPDNTDLSQPFESRPPHVYWPFTMWDWCMPIVIRLVTSGSTFVPVVIEPE